MKPTETPVKPGKAGAELLQDPVLNKGTAFPYEERKSLGLVGLLPPRVSSPDQQLERALANVRARPDDLDKYVEMLALMDRNENLFFRVVAENIEEMLPIIYTPTVGRACQTYARIWRRPRGIFLSRKERGRFKEVLANWPRRDARVIVVTDGERVLGLGDLGANGMPIAIGKLALYTACAGVHPAQTLPITLDVGTNNPALLEDRLYLGLPEKRLAGKDYDDFVDEFMSAVKAVFPKALVQFEDFANHNAFRLLEKYRGQACCFNDDIQGTAAVALAGILSAGRVTKTRLTEQRVLFHGAGEAAVGTADLIVTAMTAEGLSKREAMARCWLMDTQGLVESSRKDLQDHKKPYAHPHAPVKDLLSAVRELKPTVLVGASGKGKQFTKEVVEELAKQTPRPLILALGTPNSNAECTAEQAYRWSQAKALFAGGSPFGPVEVPQATLFPGQANNAYIFPGVGLGVLASGAARVTDEMFLEAARTLASLVHDHDLDRGGLYPPLTRIREVSARIAARVVEIAHARGLASEPRAKDPLEAVRALQYDPAYRRYA